MLHLSATTFAELFKTVRDGAALGARMHLGVAGYYKDPENPKTYQTVVFVFSTNGERKQIHRIVQIPGFFGNTEYKAMFGFFEAAGIKVVSELGFESIVRTVANYIQSLGKIGKQENVSPLLVALNLPYHSGVKLFMYDLKVTTVAEPEGFSLSTLFGRVSAKTEKVSKSKKGKIVSFKDIPELSDDSVMYLDEIRAYWLKYGNNDRVKAPYSPLTTLYVSGIRSQLEKAGFKTNDRMVGVFLFGDAAAVGRLRMDKSVREKFIKTMFNIVDAQRLMIQSSVKK